MKQLILGSLSPRRRELMSHYKIPLTLAAPPFIEEEIPFEGDPGAYVVKLAKGKAESLHRSHPDGVILTADTAVFYDGKIYNKPATFEEAKSFLKTFSGHWVSVFTGVAVWNNHHIYAHFEESKLLFNQLSDKQIESFLKAIHWHDKAGGFTIQGFGALIIKQVDGCANNITGLPINLVHKLLLKAGIDLWDHLS